MGSSISLCMIVKNEQDWIAQCLASVSDLVSETIVVDTGSTDNTIELARAMGAQIHNFQWTGDFSDARNYSLSFAKGDWILVLDADEVIAKEQHELVRKLIEDPSKCYLLCQRHYTIDPRLMGFVPVRKEYPLWERNYPGFFESSLVRLVPNHAGLRYEGRIHELFEHSITKLGKHSIVHSGVIIHHYGHTPEVRTKKDKSVLYRELGVKKALENRHDAKSLFELGVELNCSGKHLESAEAFRKCLKITPHDTAALVNFGYVLCELCNYEEAQAVLLRAIEINPNLHEAYCNLGVVLLRTKKLDQAEHVLRRAIALQPSYVNAMTNLAQVYAAQSRLAEAVMVLNRVLSLYPDHAQSHGMLGAIYSAGNEFECAEKFLSQALRSNPASAEVLFELGRLYARWDRPADGKHAWTRLLELDGESGLLMTLKSEAQREIEKLDRGLKAPPSQH